MLHRTGVPSSAIAVLAGALHAGDAADSDDMAAMDAQEQRGVEARLDGADRLVAEKFLLAIMDVGVMRVGADGENVVERNIPRSGRPSRRGSPSDAAAGASGGSAEIDGAGSGARPGERRAAATSAAPEGASAVDPGTSDSRKAAGNAEGDQRRQQRQRIARQRGIRADEARDVEAERIEPHARHGGVMHAGDRQTERQRAERDARPRSAGCSSAQSAKPLAATETSTEATTKGVS